MRCERRAQVAKRLRLELADGGDADPEIGGDPRQGQTSEKVTLDDLPLPSGQATDMVVEGEVGALRVDEGIDVGSRCRNVAGPAALVALLQKPVER
jgi:hypothetical protein